MENVHNDAPVLEYNYLSLTKMSDQHKMLYVGTFFYVFNNSSL